MKRLISILCLANVLTLLLPSVYAAKPQPHGKYWQELLGQVGGPVRSPLLQLTQDEKTRTREAFEACGLKL